MTDITESSGCVFRDLDIPCEKQDCDCGQSVQTTLPASEETVPATLWAVNIHGPDDIIAVPDYVTAIRFANAFNKWWLDRTIKDHHEYDPRMWAVPVEWTYSPADHATDIASDNKEYQWVFDAMAAALATREQAVRECAEKWQPIETAPKDGTAILLYCPQGDGSPGSTYRVTVGDWCEDYGGITERRDLDGRWIGQDESDGFIGWLSWDGGFSEDTMMPTHWMPLPTPPPSLSQVSAKT